MKNLNPYETEEKEALRDIAFYWLQKCHYLELEKKALLAILEENNLNISLADVIRHMNELSLKESEGWAEKDLLKTKLTPSLKHGIASSKSPSSET